MANNYIDTIRNDFVGNTRVDMSDDLDSTELAFWAGIDTPYDELDASRGERFDDYPQ